MAREKKPKAYDWQNRKFPEDWNTTTFRAYLAAKHEERYGVPYVPKSIKVEAGMIKRMIDEYGPVVVKAFIDEAFHRYKPTPKYPGINFATMYSWYKSEMVPRIIKRKQDEAKRQKFRESEVEAVRLDSLNDWL
jgi:hypothetical protein